MTSTRPTTYRFTAADLRMQDELAEHLGVARTEAIRQAVTNLRADLGLADEAQGRFAAGLVEEFGADALIEVEVTSVRPTIETRTLVDGDPATFHTVAAMDAGDLLAVFIGERGTEAALQIGSIPRRAGARLSTPVGVLPTLTTKEK